MIQNKKGLSDIVTTALIILLVAVAVAAIWSFVAPALRGTGTQFTNTQVCVSNIIEPITCKTTGPADATNQAGKIPVTIQVRRTLTDGVAVPTEFETVSGTAPDQTKLYTNGYGTSSTLLSAAGSGPTMPRAQGELISIKFDSGTVGNSPQTRVTTTYRLPDNTVVKCPSLPISCNVA